MSDNHNTLHNTWITVQNVNQLDRQPVFSNGVVN